MSRGSGASDLTSNQQLLNFVFPQRNLQLCEQPADENQFWVQDRINLGALSEDRIAQEIEQVTEKIAGNKCIQIISSEVFDILFSAIFALDDISLSNRKDIIQTLEAGLRNLIKQMDRTRVLEWAEKNFISSDNYIKIAREDHTMKTAI